MSTAEELVHAMAANERERTHLSLYDITDALLAIEDELYENGGELTEELEARMDALEGSLDSKVDRICCMIQNNQRAAEAAKAEVDRMAALAKSRTRIADGLKAYVLAMLTRLERSKVDTDRFKVRVQNNSRPAIQWTRESNDIPEPYRRVVVQLDGDKAYQEYKTSKTLPEGFEVKLGSHLRIS